MCKLKMDSNLALSGRASSTKCEARLRAWQTDGVMREALLPWPRAIHIFHMLLSRQNSSMLLYGIPKYLISTIYEVTIPTSMH
jgi:hypothetical protein